MLRSDPCRHVLDSKLDTDPPLMLASSGGLPIDEIRTLVDAVAKINDILNPPLGVDIEEVTAAPMEDDADVLDAIEVSTGRQGILLTGIE